LADTASSRTKLIDAEILRLARAMVDARANAGRRSRAIE
jgi:hypothetical protein